MEINILHISPDFNYACGVSKYVFELLQHFNNQKGYNVYFITNGGDALSKLKSENIKYKLLPFSKGWKNIFYFPFNYLALRRFCVENKIDIIHTHHRYPEFVSNLIKKRFNIKTITTAHSFVRGHKLLSFKSDKIVAVSNSVRSSITNNFNISLEKTITLYNCLGQRNSKNINFDDAATEKLKCKKDDFVVLYLGRINKIKGVDILINAFRKIRLGFPSIKLILIGSILDKVFTEMNVRQNGNIFLLSPKLNVDSYYNIASVIVLPSRIEPLGYTMLEAGYFKKPFIGSRTGGIAEFIEDGVNGFLFEPGNADDLAKKIKFVIDNPEKAKSAAEELHKKVKKYCNCEEYFAKLTSIYEELVN